MTFGSTADKGMTVTLTPDEAIRFKEGQPVTKRSGDSFGEFTVTLHLKYQFPPHPDLAKAEKAVKATGKYVYDGAEIVLGGLGFVWPGCPTYRPHTLNDALWQIHNANPLRKTLEG